MSFNLFKLKFFFILIIIFYDFQALAFDVTENDTAQVNRLLFKGHQFHYTKPDSAIYYYQLIYDHSPVRIEDLYSPLTELDKAYLAHVIEALNLTGNIHYYNDEYNRAETYYQRSLEIATGAGMDNYTGKALYDIGYVKYMINDLAAAKEYFEQSRQVYEESVNRRGILEAIHARGKTFRKLGDFTMADSCYRECLVLAFGLNDSLIIADIRINLGVLLCEQGKLEDGILLFEEALEYFEQIGNEQAISTALLNIGVVLKMVHEYDKALAYINRSTQMEEPKQQKSQLVVRYYNLADLYLEMGRKEKAYEYCLKIQAVANEIGSRPYGTECNFLLGKYYFLEEDFVKAGQYFVMASDSVGKTHHKPLMANIQLWQAKTSLRQGNYSNALEKAISSYSFSQEMNQVSLQKEASKVISEIYEKKGNYRESLKWHKLFLTHSDTLSHFEQQKEIGRIEARYNYEKKERENELLRNRASLQEQQLRNRTILAWASIAGIVLSTVLIMLLLRRYRDARQLYEQKQLLSLRQLEEKEGELEGKNRELTSKMMFLNQKNELISRMIGRLQEIQRSSDHSMDDLNEVVSELRMESPQSNWREFEAQFTQVHPDFYKRLYERHPDLSSYEQRICAFLRMNLNTKEISAITGRSAKSIEVTRSRIRTKLKLKRDDNLSSILASV